MTEICIGPNGSVDIDVDVSTIDVDVEISTIHVDVDMSGPPGPPGSGSGSGTLKRYTHIQAMPSPTWVVQHNLACHPQVIAEDAVGNAVYGTITYIDNNLLTIGFAYTITGQANCV